MPPRQPTHSPYPTPTLPPSPSPVFVSLAHSTLVRRPPHARHFFASCQPTDQPTNQPRASLMLLLQISGRLLGCLPAGTIGRCVFPSSSALSPVTFFIPLFFSSHPSFHTSFHRLSPRCLCPIFSPSLRVYILFYVTLFYYLSHFPRTLIRS